MTKEICKYISMLSVVPQLARRGAAAKMPGFIKGNCLEEGVGEPPQNTLDPGNLTSSKIQ